MRKHLGGIVVGVLLAAALGNGVRLLYRSSQEKAAVDQAYQTLKSHCARGLPIPVETGLDPLFEVLLRDPAYGHAALKGLAAEFPSVAFHEKRNAVFFLSRDLKNPDGTFETNFGSHVALQSGQNGSGSRFPSALQFRRVAVEGDLVLVEFEISKDEKKPVVHDAYSFEPGSSYITRMDVAALLNPEKPATRVYAEFFPKAKKK